MANTDHAVQIIGADDRLVGPFRVITSDQYIDCFGDLVEACRQRDRLLDLGGAWERDDSLREPGIWTTDPSSGLYTILIVGTP